MEALVWLSEEANRCARCNTWVWQWQYEDDDGVWHNHPHDQIDREADFWTCVGCKEMDGLLDSATDGGQERLPNGLQVRWFPRVYIDD